MQYNTTCPLCGLRLGGQADKTKLPKHKAECIPQLQAMNTKKKRVNTLGLDRANHFADYIRDKGL
jgi:hypothetical protein